MNNRRDIRNKNISRLNNELKDIQKEPIENFTVGLKNDNNIMEWKGTLFGPVGTPYESGVFELDISFPINYPFQPPTIKFLTRIYHPNIDKQGNICLDILKDKWSPALKISQVLLSISSLMHQPNPEDPLEPDIAKLYKDNKLQYDIVVRNYTRKYAGGGN